MAREQAVQELAHACRGHASVGSYSVLNECSTAWVPKLIDAIVEVDDATPLVWENSGGCRETVLQGSAGKGHAHCMSHYDMPTPDFSSLSCVLWQGQTRRAEQFPELVLLRHIIIF